MRERKTKRGESEGGRERTETEREDRERHTESYVLLTNDPTKDPTKA